MNLKRLIRQSDIIDAKLLTQPITIIGAGSIGSFVTLSLAKMGFADLTVWDYDVIEEENMNSQFYRIGDVGHRKLDALEQLVKDFTGIPIRKIPHRYERGALNGIVISAVDSMAARKAIWDSQLDNEDCKFVIDPRMGAENALLFVMSPHVKKDREAYASTLYDDSKSVHEPCTAKATTYCALLLAGLVVKSVKDIVTKQPYCRNTIWSIGENKFVSWPGEHRED